MISAQQLLQTAWQHQQAGRLDQAAEVYRQVIGIDPGNAKAQFMLGVIAHRTGQLDQAMDWLNKAASADPKFAEAPFQIGVIYHQQGQLEPAMIHYRRALSLQFNHPNALNNLGRAMLDTGQVPEGLRLLQQAVTVAPQNAGAQSNLGDALRLSRNLAGAIGQYRRAISIQPKFAQAHANLGAALAEQGQNDQAIASLEQAILINPALATAHYNLAKVLQSQNRLEQATAQCRRAIELKPNYAEAHNLLGNLLGVVGLVPQAIAAQRLAVQLNPGLHSAHSNVLLSLHYLDDIQPKAIFDEHLQWAARHAAPLVASLKPISIVPHQRIRVGYISPNFNRHSVAYFFEPVLAAHDRGRFEIFCYSDSTHADEVTKRIQQSADNWRDITGQTDSAVADLIRADEIDVLVDLAGHTHNRLLVFARKPAPMQITWLGYPDTTGLSTIDFRITDAIADPSESAQFHTEKLKYIDGSCWAYQAPPVVPPLSEPPAIGNQYITFGSFNNLPKVTPMVLKTWARILDAVPKSRLVLKALGLSSQAGRDYVSAHIDPARVELLAWAPTTTSHLDLYNRIDIALDTFPYNGTTTTCEAMLMGVPVIAFPGNMHAGRVSASLLTSSGCTESLATDIESYIQRAIELASDVPRLMQLRSSLRERFSQSPVCDAARLARQLEEIYASGR